MVSSICHQYPWLCDSLGRQPQRINEYLQMADQQNKSKINNRNQTLPLPVPTERYETEIAALKGRPVVIRSRDIPFDNLKQIATKSSRVGSGIQNIIIQIKSDSTKNLVQFKQKM